MKLTRKQLKHMIKEELARATPAEVVVASDVTTPEGIASQIQKIYSMLAQLQTDIYNLKQNV